MRYIREVIGAKDRCSNHVLLSFGICENTPIMQWGDIVGILTQSYTTVWVVEENPFQTEIIKSWIKTHEKGHYVLLTRNHVIAVHGDYVVDTSQRGIGRTRVQSALQITGSENLIDRSFKEYMKIYPENVFRV